jgi:hypothetical protein
MLLKYFLNIQVLIGLKWLRKRPNGYILKPGTGTVEHFFTVSSSVLGPV